MAVHASARATLTRAVVALTTTLGCAPGTLDPSQQHVDPVVDPNRLVELRSYWNPALGDNALTTNPTFAAPGYTLYRVEGRVFRPDEPQPAGTQPIHSWYNASRGDYFTTTNALWRPSRGTVIAGYTWVRLEGYAYSQNLAGTAPLELWWSTGRQDYITTSDPAWTERTTPLPDYAFTRLEGYVLPAADESHAAPAEAFHFGTMGGGPRGERRLLVVQMEYRDQPFHLTTAQVDNLFFGPAFPNVRDYFRDVSYGAFAFARGGVARTTPIDDPDTTGDESTWAHTREPSDPMMALASLGLASGRMVAATNGGGAGTLSTPGINTWELFGVVDVNGGSLVSGDAVAFKAHSGHYLCVSGSALVASCPSAAESRARFFIAQSGGGVIRPGNQVTLRSVSTRRYVQETAAGIDVAAANTSSPATLLRIDKRENDPTRWGEQSVLAAARAGFDFAAMDANRDGAVTRDELQVLLYLGSRSINVLAQLAGAPNVEVQGVSVRLEALPRIGEHGALTTFVHELAHTLGAADLYGNDGTLNRQLTPMGATMGRVDDRRVFHLDPWHKMRFGWERPVVVAVNESGGSRTLTPRHWTTSTQSDSSRPLLLYSTQRYDVRARSGEFFMIERRKPGTTYEFDVPADGFYVWQCRTDASGNSINIPAVTGTGVDASINLYGAPSGIRGGNTPWASSDPFALSYIDGAASGISLRMRAGALMHGVEWSWNTTAIRSRIDRVGALVDVPCTTPGPTCPQETVGVFVRNAVGWVEGEFGATIGSLTLRNITTGTLYSHSVTPQAMGRGTFFVPTALPSGVYDINLGAGTSASNTVRVTVQ